MAFEQEKNNEEFLDDPLNEEAFGADEVAVEVDTQASMVASKPAKNILILIAIGIVSISLAYYSIFGSKEKEKPPVVQDTKLYPPVEQSQGIAARQPITKEEQPIEEENTSIALPPLPNIPNINIGSIFDRDIEPVETDTPPPQPPQPLQAPPQPPSSTSPLPNRDDIDALQTKRAKRSVPMLLINGGPVDFDEQAVENINNSINRTSPAAQIITTHIGNTDFLIAQGKIIETILETAINTDLPGILRGIISRDIYAESGKNVLIPKGSRIIGSYGQSISRGQSRILITWNRLIRPDGTDLSLGFNGTDQLGRSGIPGRVDNKYFQVFTNSLLLSVLTIGTSALFDEVANGGDSSSTTVVNDEGSSITTDTGSPTAKAIEETVGKITDVAGTVLLGLVNNQPTITVDQGTRIKVFVNKDIIFPPDSVSKVRFIE